MLRAVLQEGEQTFDGLAGLDRLVGIVAGERAFQAVSLRAPLVLFDLSARTNIAPLSRFILAR